MTVTIYVTVITTSNTQTLYIPSNFIIKFELPKSWMSHVPEIINSVRIKRLEFRTRLGVYE